MVSFAHVNPVSLYKRDLKLKGNPLSKHLIRICFPIEVSCSMTVLVVHIVKGFPMKSIGIWFQVILVLRNT
jgi:hypothetical protein